MSFIFNTFFFKPLLNALGFLTVVLPGNSYGVAIVILTVLVNLILLPITHRTKKSQQRMQELQPEIKKIQAQFKDKKDEQARRLLELYREHGINPFSGLLFAVVQIPIFFALFKIFQNGGRFFASDLYSFMLAIPPPDTLFLGFLDLTQPSFYLALVAGIFQFTQLALIPTQKSGEKDTSFGSLMQRNMKYSFPVLIVILGLNFPSALTLYWTTMSVFGIVHEAIVRYTLRLRNSYGNSNRGTKESRP